MEIELTAAQWVYLKTLVTQGAIIERAIARPIEIHNETIFIEIEDEKTTIILPD